MSELYLYSARKSAQKRLLDIISQLTTADSAFGHQACVYATGSFGRLEAGPNSDLDLFIVVETDKHEKHLLNNIDEIKLKYQLINTAETIGVAKFDGGGRFLTSHSVDSFTKWLGSSEDDVRNTLTGRMLMLLESKPLIGQSIYQHTIDLVINKYFRDYPGHEINFTPSFLFNDIIRMWRTFCVNYEFNRKEGDSRNKIKNLKLKFSRMLTCYSAIIYLMALYARNNCVSPDDVNTMVKLSPTERLEFVANKDFGFDSQVAASLNVHVYNALSHYSDFLALAHLDQRKAARLYKSNESKWRNDSYEFGRHLSSMIDTLDETSQSADNLRRLVLI